MQTPISILPDNYVEAKHLVATEQRTLLWLNLASLVPLVLALLFMGWWGAVVRQLRGPYNTAFSESLSWLIAGGIVVCVTFGGQVLGGGCAPAWRAISRSIPRLPVMVDGGGHRGDRHLWRA